MAARYQPRGQTGRGAGHHWEERGGQKYPAQNPEQVTGPTKGQIMAKGRIASLLEVGTGFHHELTGRENIFLNGALLGMTKYEVNRKLDEIVDFAGVERYLDTPVKRYSSGMTVRLGFAVAAHLDPEILIVDEVLAVGDAEFQKKSIGKMESVNKSGRTILFVSHQMDMIKALCNKTALLTDGVLKSVGGTDQIIQEYIQFESDKNPSSAQITTPLNPEVPIQILSIGLKDITGNFKKSFEVFEDVFLEIEHLTKEPTIGAIITFEVFRNESPVFVSFDTDQNPELLDNRLTGRFISLIKIPKKFLKPGNYKIEANAGIANSRIIHKIPTPLGLKLPYYQNHQLS